MRDNADFVGPCRTPDWQQNRQGGRLPAQFDWWQIWIRLRTPRDRPISQIQCRCLNSLRSVMPPNQYPSAERCTNQDAGRYCKQRAFSPKLIRFLKLRKISVARTARAEVIQPLLRFRERHPMRRHAFQDVGGRASDAFGIRKLCEQTPAQRMQDALFFLRGIWLVAQRSSPRIRLNPKRARNHI